MDTTLVVWTVDVAAVVVTEVEERALSPVNLLDAVVVGVIVTFLSLHPPLTVSNSQEMFRFLFPPRSLKFLLLLVGPELLQLLQDLTGLLFLLPSSGALLKILSDFSPLEYPPKEYLGEVVTNLSLDVL